MSNKKSEVIAIDFDGTCVTHEFPLVGLDIGAAPVLKKLAQNGHKLMLWTMRGSGKELADAVKWFEVNEIPLWGINENPIQQKRKWSLSHKQHASLYIDDAALGAPLLYNPVICDRPFINWDIVEATLTKLDLI